MLDRVTCRACGESGLRLVLSLGRTPLANGLLHRDALSDPEPRYPLDVAFCPACTLLQITETVPPEDLFRDYVYFSSVSTTALENAAAIVRRLSTVRHLDEASLAVEIASNDGYLLQFYRDLGIRVLGIEPARNIAAVAEARGIPTVSEFFGLELARQLAASQRADVIHANNVLAHVPDLNGVVDGIRVLLREGGLAVLEVPYVKDLIDRVEFDTIYHEHLCYFSLTTIERLFARHGLLVADVERLAIHGGSLRVFVEHDDGVSAASPAVRALLEEEREWGVDRFEFYAGFAARVNALKHSLVECLQDRKRRGERIAAYGASAKGSTLLNCFGIGGDILDFVVDRSTVKQGLFTPGTHLPIRPPEALLEAMPGSVLLLTWNFADEILEQQAEYRRRGGKFIIPVPQPQVV